MDIHALEFYSAYSDSAPHGHFHQVIALHDNPLIEWKEARKLAPALGRGWYELAQLSLQDRITFTKEFWLTKLPYHPSFDEFLDKFFASLDDVGIFLTQQKYDDPFEPQLIYSLSDNSGFFHGRPPATENEIINLQKVFVDYILPADYLAFLQIHNGFAKLTDTGITPSTDMQENYDNFQKMLKEEAPPLMTTASGVAVDPKTLIPFYQSFHMPFFQCFWAEWHPGQEMGNVYYSDTTKTISDCTKSDCVESLAFETFTDWLMFYLEKID